MERFAQMSGSASWGSPNLGGSLATAGGIVFAGGAMDRRVRAFDQQTGAELWSFEFTRAFTPRR
jgi:quinoprotein glucose dehydrogenase